MRSSHEPEGTFESDKARLRDLGGLAYEFGYPLVLASLLHDEVAGDHFGRFFVITDSPVQRSIAVGSRIASAAEWLDLRQPVRLTLSATHRYYAVTLYDAWMNPFISLGSRTTGSDTQTYLLNTSSSGSRGEGAIEITVPTETIAARIAIEAADERDGLQAITALVGQQPEMPVSRVDQRQLVSRLEALTLDEFFQRMSALIEKNGSSNINDEVREALGVLGVGAGKGRWPHSLSKARREEVLLGVRAARRRLASAKIGTLSINGWSIAFQRANVSDHFEEHAAQARSKMYPEFAEDAVCYARDRDSNGDLLDGRFSYRMTFNRWTEPQSRGPWFVCTTPMLRESGSSAVHRDDGSFTVRIQRRPPTDAPHENWLPVEAGPFRVVLKIFWPSEAVLTAAWIPPPIEIMSTAS